MDLTGNELWKGRGLSNETREEFLNRLFDDSGVQSAIKQASLDGRVFVVTHSNIIKHLLLTDPDNEKDH